MWKVLPKKKNFFIIFSNGKCSVQYVTDFPEEFNNYDILVIIEKHYSPNVVFCELEQILEWYIEKGNILKIHMTQKEI